MIVDDDMKRPANRVRVKLAEVQGFLDDPLTRERSISVDQNHHAPPPIGVAHAVLFCAHPPDRNWIHEFQMARIETE